MPVKLSHSSISKYNHCPKHYDLYYNENLRAITASAFLPFGRAIDQCLNVILKEYQQTGQVTIDFRQLFDSNWQTVEINRTVYNLYDCTIVGYAKADFDSLVLNDEDIAIIAKQTALLCPEYISYDIDKLKEELGNVKANGEAYGLEQRHLKLINIINWHCLRRKGHLMLDAYITGIIPKISKVLSIQKEWEMTAPNGDRMGGYLDVVVELVGLQGKYVLDNKTSRRKYKPEEAQSSRQLAVYAFSENTANVGFAVMLKDMKHIEVKTCKSCGNVSEAKHKTCDKETEGVNAKGKPKMIRCNGEWDIKRSSYCETQFLVDKIPNFVQNTIIDNVGEIAKSISAGIFPKNLDSCDNFFGERCPMFNKCWKNSETNLIRVDNGNNKNNNDKK